MDHIQSLLHKRIPDEPAEARAIKHYVEEQFQASVAVTVNDQRVLIRVPSAALANALRFRLPALQELCGADKRLTLRIGS